LKRVRIMGIGLDGLEVGKIRSLSEGFSFAGEAH